MRPTVRIAFDLSLSGAGDFFTIGDPVKGVWGAGSSPLAGEILIDVSDDVRAVNIRRGRSSETSNVDAGSGTVTLDNRTRRFDPLASASITPFAPSILPRKEITVDIGGRRQFSGIVEDWDLQYDRGGDSVTFAKMTDGLTLLNERNLASGAGATGLSGSVIYEAASAVAWPLGRLDLDDGTATVGAHTLDALTNVLSYMQKISNTEQALLFIGKDGALAYRDRISPRRRSGTVFADDGTGIRFSNIRIEYGTEFLFTNIEIKYPTGTVTAQSSASAVANFGSRELSLDTFLPDASSASAIAVLLAEKYGEPTLRIKELEFEMNALPNTQQATVLDLELGDGVRVIFTPNGIGDPINRELAVEGIEHDTNPRGHIARVRLYDPVLLRRTGSVTGTSSNVGSVTGVVGFFGSAAGSSSETGSVAGFAGYFGSATGSSESNGSVTGTKLTAFVLDTSELDGNDRLN